MVDVLLIQPPIRDYYFTKKRSIPYGLISLASSLVQSGYSVEVFDALASNKSRVIETPVEMGYLDKLYGRKDCSPFALFHEFKHFGYSYQTIQKVAKGSQAFLVGISAMFTPYSDVTASVVETIRRTLPEAYIVVGGQHATALPEEVLTIPDVDFVIRGEAELALPALLKRLKDNESPEGVPGLAFRGSDGSVKNEGIAIAGDLDDLPIPDYRHVKNEFYRRKNGCSAAIVTSRGCPLDCSYCSVGKTSGIPYRRRSVTSVLEEIDQLVTNFGVRFIDFEDENLTFSKKWTVSLLKGIIQRYGPRFFEFRAMNGLMPSTLGSDLVELMREAGFRTLNLSLCALSEEQLRRFNRRNQKKAFESVLDVAERLDMEVVSYIIVGAPYQRAIDSLNDLKYLADKNTIIGVSVYYPSPKSPFYEQNKGEDFFPKENILYRSSALPVSQTTSRLETITLLRLGRFINYLKSTFPEYLGKTGSTVEPVNINENQKILLRSIFQNRKLKGIDHNDQFFEHNVDENLVNRCVDYLSERIPNSLSHLLNLYD